MPEKEEHRFWSTQPVVGKEEGEISPLEDRSKKQLQLPAGFEFVTLTIEDLDDIHALLKENYVEDPDEMFRLYYSKELLKWQFSNPSHKSEYLLGVKKDNELYGFTFAKEHIMMVKEKEIRMVSINFLCVVRMLRNRRLSPLIIKEITRRAILNGIHQAVFTGGITLPFKFSHASYFHRVLNRKKLMDLNYSDKSSNLSKELSIFDWKIRAGTREVEEKDIEQLMILYNEKCKKYSLYEKMDEINFRGNFMTQDNLIYTLVHEQDNKITEFVSIYLLNTLCTTNQKEIKTAYIYYSFYHECFDIIKDVLIFAKNLGCDLCNALDVMDNNIFFSDLSFQKGTGTLNYYLFNWNTEPVDGREIHFLMP